MSPSQTAPIHLLTANGTADVTLAGLTLGCLIYVSESLTYHKQPTINGVYDIDGAESDLRTILQDPRATLMLKYGYPDGIPDGERIEIAGIRFPEGVRP